MSTHVIDLPESFVSGASGPVRACEPVYMLGIRDPTKAVFIGIAIETFTKGEKSPIGMVRLLTDTNFPQQDNCTAEETLLTVLHARKLADELANAGRIAKDHLIETNLPYYSSSSTSVTPLICNKSIPNMIRTDGDWKISK